MNIKQRAMLNEYQRSRNTKNKANPDDSVSYFLSIELATKKLSRWFLGFDILHKIGARSK